MMNRLIFLIVALLSGGCRQPSTPPLLWEERLPSIVIVEQGSTNHVPKQLWTEFEKSIFSNTNDLKRIALHAELDGALSVTHDEESNYTSRIIDIDKTELIMKREGLSRREEPEHISAP
jgi:hypothetical protein